MFKQIFENSGWLSKLFQLIFIGFFFLIFGFLIWTVTGGNASSVVSQKIFQLISALFLFVLPVVFLSRYWYQEPVKEYSLNKIPMFNQILLVFFLVIIIQPCINMLAYVNEQIQLPQALEGLEKIFKDAELSAAETTKKLLTVSTIGGYIFNLFLIALLPAISEELFFRGAVQKIFSEKFSKYIAVWITAFFFSLIHFQMYGFIPRMILGAILGYLLVWTRSLWIPILAHFLNNALAISVAYFSNSNNYLTKLEDLGKKETIYYGLVSTIISIFLLWIISKTREKNI